MKDRIIALMRQAEPNYNNWTDESINDQLDVIYECGYEWFEENNRFGFKHSKSGFYLKISGLNFYPPEEFRRTYDEVWSKDYEGVQTRYYYGKTLKGILFLIIGIVSSFFIKREYSLIINALIVIYISYNYIKYKGFQKKKRLAIIKKEKRNGSFVDTNEIVWCKNCIDYKKVRGWQSNDIYQSEQLVELKNIPCIKYPETKDIWLEYFNTPLSDRYLYPKNCRCFKRK